MKHFVFTFSFIVLLLVVDKAHGQSSGGFSIGTHSVAYSISPSLFIDSLNVILNIDSTTPTYGGAVIPLSIAVLDASNTVLMNWTPSPANNYYYHYFDISSLSAGNYHVNVLDSTLSTLETISFTK